MGLVEISVGCRQCLNCGNKSGENLASELGAAEIETPKALKKKKSGECCPHLQPTEESKAPSRIKFAVFWP